MAAHVELVAIGDELLLGETVDTNSSWIARRLADAGIRVVRKTTVGDDVAHIVDAIRAALGRTGTVVCTGGLGPTHDDLTRDALALVTGAPLETRDEWVDELQRRYVRRGIPMPEVNRVQALVPRGGTLLPNTRGTAPGIAVRVARTAAAPAAPGATAPDGPAAADAAPTPADGLVIVLPGVPNEMRGLMDDHVVALLCEHLGASGRVASWMLRTTGISEAAMAERLHDVAHDCAPFTLAFLPGTNGVDLRLTCDAAGAAGEHDDRLHAIVAAIRHELGDAVYTEGADDLAVVTGNLLRQHGLTLALAESCTGGLVATRLTDTGGSSAFLLAGFVTYSNDAKHDHLGVRRETIALHGAVSELCAREMAEGARRAGRADVAVSITGIAGPGGGSDDKPVGTVWFAAATEQGTETRHAVFPGERADIRERAAQMALDMVRRTVMNRA